MFITPIGVIDAIDHLEYAKSLYDGRIDIPRSSSHPCLKTTLNSYSAISGNSIPLPQDDGYKKLTNFFVETSISYLDFLGYQTQQFDFEVMDIWLNEAESGNQQEPHNHCGHNITGCLYVDFPKGSQGLSFYGPLSRIDKRYLPIKKGTNFNSPTWTIFPKEGELLIWESNLVHFVGDSQHSGLRRTISFDVSAVKNNIQGQNNG